MRHGPSSTRLASSLLASSLLAASLLAACPGPADAQNRGFGAPHPFHAGGGGHGGGHGGGPGGGHGGGGRARAAVYDVLTVSSVTDAAGLKAALAKLGPSLAGTGGRLVVDADDPAPVAGTAPSHLAILIFDDAHSAGLWQASPAYKAIAAEVAKTGTLQVSAAGGIADPGAPPTVPLQALGPARGLDKLPAIPKIADICRGC